MHTSRRSSPSNFTRRIHPRKVFLPSTATKNPAHNRRSLRRRLLAGVAGRRTFLVHREFSRVDHRRRRHFPRRNLHQVDVAVAAEPARVSKLVLMAPDGFASFCREYGRTPERLPWLMRLLPYTAPKPLLERTMRNAYAVPGTLTDAVVERYHAMLLAPGVRRAILDRVLQTRLLQPEPILATIRAPVLLLWGERDSAVPASHAADYERALPDARTIILPGIGHVPMEEAPEASARALRAFLD